MKNTPTSLVTGSENLETGVMKLLDTLQIQIIQSCWAIIKCGV